MHTIEDVQFRRLALARQGLQSNAIFGQGLNATLAAIEHLGYIQIDTISMIERAHHHVLWTRVADYQPIFLNQLVENRQIFEYWFHAAAYLPMRDYRFALHRMAAVRDSTWAYYRDIDHKIMSEILLRVRNEGPLRIRDLENTKGKSGSWWNWGPAKRAMEKLFLQGDLMVCQRIGMEKVYDLSERQLPSGLDMRQPDVVDYAGYLLNSYLRAHSIVTFEQLTHLHTNPALKKTMRELVASKIVTNEIQSLNNSAIPNAYVETDALTQALPAVTCVHLLSPFDNAIIHRKRLNQLFGYDYKLECYVPAGKRKYGYFCLPILYGEQFVGRMDCKAHRQQQRLEVISIHLEGKIEDWENFVATLLKKLQQFALFNGCVNLDIFNVKGVLVAQPR
ncbi:winged helix-turn-helix domain-containing protein [Deefgea piscis]|uniref:Winged helix-turn-helix domain-containing protein n=1 Tax=Deefgea piscis TaxID=2739061 RepID=A0A6M8SPU4_9NEIS|nr:crosslink repair DNA glycosylase YcaQ family protein [Deefgea piscis]QKJ67282.1 winged helix-turn-helix domain-containing protein [Deefgea piscis]